MNLSPIVSLFESHTNRIHTRRRLGLALELEGPLFSQLVLGDSESCKLRSGYSFPCLALLPFPAQPVTEGK